MGLQYLYPLYCLCYFELSHLEITLVISCHYLLFYFLDYLTDGQLGYGEENSLSPCLVDGFQDLGSPETLQDEAQNTLARTPLKV